MAERPPVPKFTTELETPPTPKFTAVNQTEAKDQADSETAFREGETKRRELLTRLSQPGSVPLLRRTLRPEDEDSLPIWPTAFHRGNYGCSSQKDNLEHLRQQVELLGAKEAKEACKDLEQLSDSAVKLLKQHENCIDQKHYLDNSYRNANAYIGTCARIEESEKHIRRFKKLVKIQDDRIRALRSRLKQAAEQDGEDSERGEEFEEGQKNSDEDQDSGENEDGQDLMED